MNNLDPYDDFFKKIRKINSSYVNPNIPIIPESLKFQIETYKEISKRIKYNNNDNITKQQLYFYENIVRKKPFVILKCDKNLGLP